MAARLFRSGTILRRVQRSRARRRRRAGEPVLIVDGNPVGPDRPGRRLLYTPLSLALPQYAQPRDLTYIFASHQDPDIIGSVDGWLLYAGTHRLLAPLGPVHPAQRAALPEERRRRPPAAARRRRHRDPARRYADPRLPVAHFLHSVGNFQFYDRSAHPVQQRPRRLDDRRQHTITNRSGTSTRTSRIAGFHRRYMASNRACRWWADARASSTST